MPQIFDNIEQQLHTALNHTLESAYRADFCVGYFNLRGWRQIDEVISGWAGTEDSCCRLLVGMQRGPEEELRAALSLLRRPQGLDQGQVRRMQLQLARGFRNQLMLGVPTNSDESGLRRLVSQLRGGQLRVKLFLRHPLHAKLYLLHRKDFHSPIIGYLGSSNLTFSGLSGQGELNIDVLDSDASGKLARWFEARWTDRWCVDITEDLIKVIEESWARSELIPPYQIYVKMAYHLSQEARTGLTDFRVPHDVGRDLLEYQVEAVKIAAHHLHRRQGVLLGDVVGLGKTMMATALARVFQDDLGLETLIICPANLMRMWETYQSRYRLLGKIISINNVQRELPLLRRDVRRYRLIIIDESHNLRNREGRRYRAIRDYIEYVGGEARVILLSATPYNKTYHDLSNQLRLFVAENQELAIRPERLLREIGEETFARVHNCGVRTLAAFDKSPYSEDWRELMRLYMVRRTRGFIQQNYAQTDEETGRKYLLFPNGNRSYFARRLPKTERFAINDFDPEDQFARLYSATVVETLNALSLPRYGLGNYIDERKTGTGAKRRPKNSDLITGPDETEKKILDDLGRAGKRLMGFCRTNLFKRLESSGHAFLQSIERHVLRNHVFIFALEHGLPLPIGTQNADLLDSPFVTGDEDGDLETLAFDFDNAEIDPTASPGERLPENTEATVPEVNLPGFLFDVGLFADNTPAPETSNGVDVTDTDALIQPETSPEEARFRRRAAAVYHYYRDHAPNRFRWVRSNLFQPSLASDLRSDAAALLGVLRMAGKWHPEHDAKLSRLLELVQERHGNEKVLIFTQFADTALYLQNAFAERGITKMAAVTGGASDPTELVRRFSPRSNQALDVASNQELRVLLATDVLSEGQNLQDCAIVVNYDIPWAIIRLIQRAGRVDRIGQEHPNILCYTFLPADGVERIIRLRARVVQRLEENAEVVGTDETFFDDEAARTVLDLYHEKANVLDGEPDTEVDLASYALQIWKSATGHDSKLEKAIKDMPDVVFSTKGLAVNERQPDGALVYLRTARGNDALAWIGPDGRSLTESQFAILRAAECSPEEPAVERRLDHHELVAEGIQHIAVEEQNETGGNLGSRTGARRRTYERLKQYLEREQTSLFPQVEIGKLRKAVEEIFKRPLTESSTVALNRQLRSGISDTTLVELILSLQEEGRLTVAEEDDAELEPQIICSMGLKYA